MLRELFKTNLNNSVNIQVAKILCEDEDALDGCIVIALDIHIDIECRDEDHDGLVGDGVHGSGVSHFVSVSALAGVFILWLNIVFHLADFFIYQQRNFFNSICSVVFSTDF